MKWTILLPLLLLGCAGARTVRDAPGRSETGSAAPPAARSALAQREAARRWSPALRASVLRQCQVAIPDDVLCTCLTRQLELLSPDPDTEFTDGDIQAGLSACRSTGAGRL